MRFVLNQFFLLPFLVFREHVELAFSCPSHAYVCYARLFNSDFVFFLINNESSNVLNVLFIESDTQILKSLVQIIFLSACAASVDHIIAHGAGCVVL